MREDSKTKRTGDGTWKKTKNERVNKDRPVSHARDHCYYISRGVLFPWENWTGSFYHLWLWTRRGEKGEEREREGETNRALTPHAHLCGSTHERTTTSRHRQVSREMNTTVRSDDARTHARTHAFTRARAHRF